MAQGSVERSDRWPDPPWIFLLGAGGFAVGVGLLYLGSSRTVESARFTQSSGFLVWATAIGAQTAFWVVVAGPLWARVVTLVREIRAGATPWLMAILLLLTVAGFALFSPAVTDWPLWGHEAKLRSLTLIGFVGVGIPAVFGIALVESQVRKRIARPCEDEDLDDAIKAHREIVQLLFTAGVAIGLAVLATGALRAAVVPDFVSESTFPEVYVLLFGAFFSGLLLLVYAPAYISLRRFAVRIRDGFFPRSSRPRPDADSFKEWLEKRAALEELLQMNVAARQQLETGLFILTPLLSGIIGAFVPGG